MRRRALLLVLAAGALVPAACGYHLVGTVSSLPPEIDRLYVAPFDDTTGSADIDQRLNEAVVREWVRRRRYELVKTRDDAQIVLRGTLSSLSTTPVTVDQQGRATEYQMTLTLHAQLVDVRGDEPEVLWEDKRFSRRTSYTVDVNAINYFDRRIEAIEDVADVTARDLVTAILEGF